MGNSNGKPVVFTDEGVFPLVLSSQRYNALNRFNADHFHMVKNTRQIGCNM